MANLASIVKPLSNNPEDEMYWDKVIPTPDKLLVIDLHQDWCGPCETLQPTMGRIFLETSECALRCSFLTASMDKFKAKLTALLPEDISTKLATQGCMPFLILVKGGNVVAHISGANAPALLQHVKLHMPEAPGSSVGGD